MTVIRLPGTMVIILRLACTAPVKAIRRAETARSVLAALPSKPGLPRGRPQGAYLRTAEPLLRGSKKVDEAIYSSSSLTSLLGLCPVL